MNKEMDFEAALAELEAEVKKLETGNMPLQESLATFESAVKLVKLCNEKLESAERSIKILVEGADGIITDKIFEGSYDET